MAVKLWEENPPKKPCFQDEVVWRHRNSNRPVEWFIGLDNVKSFIFYDK